jgi:hypothetical protein
MEAELKSAVVPKLRSHGFKGSYPHFRRFADERIDLLTFQHDKWGGGFVIEIACALRRASPRIGAKYSLRIKLPHGTFTLTRENVYNPMKGQGRIHGSDTTGGNSKHVPSRYLRRYRAPKRGGLERNRARAVRDVPETNLLETPPRTND